MRELDAVLQGFVQAPPDRLSDADIACFAAILELPDPELYAYLLGRREPEDGELARLLETIRASGAARD
jgi:succinate dehydrogenase flavin-adding protein (antitoxin of CptAB toxin-antitoxin module)